MDNLLRIYNLNIAIYDTSLNVHEPRYLSRRRIPALPHLPFCSLNTHIHHKLMLKSQYCLSKKLGVMKLYRLIFATSNSLASSLDFRRHMGVSSVPFDVLFHMLLKSIKTRVMRKCGGVPPIRPLPHLPQPEYGAFHRAAKSDESDHRH